ncbi:MAG TPA: ABC transporter ATP-binding protein [Bryobacteraceae bacterium]|nr:ABC transporter ATP-binding protein [Bryobacteraceae bacterium]
MKPYGFKATLAYVALAASVGMTLLRPWPLKLILDSVILEKQSLSAALPFLPSGLDTLDKHLLLTILCGALVAIVLLESIFGFWQKILFSIVGQSATTDVLDHVFTHLQTLPKALAGTRTGDVIVRLTSDVKTLRDLLVNHIQKLGSYGLTFFSTIAVMMWMNWQLTAVAMIVVPFIFATSHYFSKTIRDATKRKRTKEGEVASIVQETLQSLAVVQAFVQEQAERSRLRVEAQKSLDASLESTRLGGAFTRTIKVLSTVGTAMVIWLGASRVLEGQLSPGDLVVFAAYIAELYTPIQNVSELAVQFMESLVSGERVLGLLQTAPQIKDAPLAVKAPRFRGSVEFDNVVFGYQPGSPILRGMSFTVEPGQTVAIVGGSGAGKSTILNLIMRFVDPWQGSVRFDGRDIRHFRLQSVRRQISVVMQESILFRRSVRENIAYGRSGASDHEIIAAAQAAHAHEFIEELPDGYDTMLDEQGGNLSGGQRQRIALARAFLRNAPILLLDEPTSGLDAVTEAQLSETLEELARGKTTIVVAHRFSTIEKSDKIIVLEGGEVVQQGTHPELIAREGLYRQLFEAQAATAEETAS